MPEEFVKESYKAKSTLSQEVLENADVLYQTRVQAERFADISEYEKVKDEFLLTKEKVMTMKARAMILHPLPRVNELPAEIDELPQAHYFTQAANAVPARMALLDLLLS